MEEWQLLAVGTNCQAWPEVDSEGILHGPVHRHGSGQERSHTDVALAEHMADLDCEEVTHVERAVPESMEKLAAYHSAHMQVERLEAEKSSKVGHLQVQ